MSNAPDSRLIGESRYGSGCGSPAGRTNALRNGASASVVTIHGDNVLAKFFDRNGPSGWYSHGWMSRAVQSLNSASPKTRDSASFIDTASPRSFGVPMITP